MRLISDNYHKLSINRNRLAIAAVLSLSIALGSCGDQKTALDPIRPVKAMIVEPALTERTLTYSGVLAPRIESTLGFRVSGKIIERFVNVGDQIKTGEPIARLDEKDLKLAENSARASVEAAKSRLAVAKDALWRGKELLPKGFIPKAVVDQRQLEADAAQANLDAAKDQLGQAVNATSYATLLADKEGVVTSVRAEPGQVVSVGQAVVTLARSGDLEVAVSVPEQEIASLQPGQSAEISLWAAHGTRIAGKIREIAGTADPASRTYAVRVSIADPSPAMRLGMTAPVSFRVPEAVPAAVLPLTALAKVGGKTIVFVAGRDTETVSAREIEILGVTGDGVKVGAGIKPGEVVVTAGVQFLRDGTKVRLPKQVLTAMAETDAQRR
jgi:multidrug efflux system membrane fusion protein